MIIGAMFLGALLLVPIAVKLIAEILERIGEPVNHLPRGHMRDQL